MSLTGELAHSGRAMDIWHELLNLMSSFWLEVLAGVIAAGVVAFLAYLYQILPPWRARRKVLVYVSSGSTCRDPMAKAITEQLLVGRRLKHPIDIYAVGLAPTETGPTFAAQHTINEMFGRDLLKNHKPSPLTPDLVKKADLILVMDKRLYETTEFTLPREKTHILKEFFGLHGDVADPYRGAGERDAQTLARYKACADELRKILSENIDNLLRALGA